MNIYFRKEGSKQRKEMMIVIVKLVGEKKMIGPFSYTI